MTAGGWEEAIDEFALHLREGRVRYSTVSSHRSHLRFIAARTSSGPWALGTDELVALLVARGASRRNTLASARLFYAWALRRGYVTRSPVPVSVPGFRGAGRALAPVAWRECLDSYERWLLAGARTASTVKLHLSYLRRLAEQCPDPWAVTSSDLGTFLAGRTWKPETRRSARAACVGFYGWAQRHGHVTASPASELLTVRIPRALPRPTNADGLTRALEAACDRDRLMLLLAAYAGLRCAEIAAVRPSTDIDDGVLRVIGKGDRERHVPLHPRVVAAIEEELSRRRSGRLGTGFRYKENATADGYLFPGPGGRHVQPGAVVRRLSAALGDAGTGHQLRHRFASQAYATHRDLRAVQELLGHSKPETTARYTAVPDGALRAAVLGIQ